MKQLLKNLLFFSLSIFLVVFLFNKGIIAAATIVDKSDLGKNSIDSDDKVIYLTFDDGPSYHVTDKVLDILKEKDVKATFFLIGSEIRHREVVVKRIKDEGHSIGLHTFTHKFNCIYCNDDAFIKEMIDCSEEINRVIGVSPNIIRFPGGSYKHLNNRLLEKLHNNNLRVYDWNVDNSDGLNPNLSPYQLYRKSIKGSDKLQTVILLMHCTDMNKNTCEALPKIIDYYKDQGYIFKVIEEDTPEMYFRIR